MKLSTKIKCFFGYHSKVYWDDERCEQENALTGVFRPWECECGEKSAILKYPPMPIGFPITAPTAPTVIELNKNVLRTLKKMHSELEPFNDSHSNLIDLANHAEDLAQQIERELTEMTK